MQIISSQSFLSVRLGAVAFRRFGAAFPGNPVKEFVSGVFIVFHGLIVFLLVLVLLLGFCRFGRLAALALSFSALTDSGISKLLVL